MEIVFFFCFLPPKKEKYKTFDHLYLIRKLLCNYSFLLSADNNELQSGCHLAPMLYTKNNNYNWEFSRFYDETNN